MHNVQLPEMPNFLREHGESDQEKKLPESITSLLDGSSKTMCRLSWKSLVTGFQSHGDWFDLINEQMLQREVDSMNIKYAGVLTHWLEYK